LQLLSTYSERGRNEFYQGETAQKLVTFLNKKGGNMTIKDLNTYEAKWRAPITLSTNLKITSPPSSGRICLNQIMKMIEPFNLAEMGIIV
jgi:gamma-glutamyltranspeptidase/glutathione hydrolase